MVRKSLLFYRNKNKEPLEIKVNQHIKSHCRRPCLNPTQKVLQLGNRAVKNKEAIIFNNVSSFFTPLFTFLQSIIITIIKQF